MVRPGAIYDTAVALLSSPRMRHILRVAAVACAAGFASAQEPATLTIANVTVIDGAGSPARLADVRIRGGEIVAITTPAGTSSGGEVVDGRGRFLIPGLWDMHVHLATRPEPDLAEKMMLPLFLAHGIVGVRDMGGPIERVTGIRRQLANGTMAGPRILTPGPFVDGPGEASGLFRRPADAAAAAADVRSLMGAGADFIKTQSGLSPEIHAALAQAAHTAKLPLAGHIPIAMTAAEVIAAGQRSLDHVSPALVGDGMLLFACSSKSEELLRELRAIEKDRAAAAASAIAERETALRARLVDTYDPARARALGASMAGRDVWIVPTLVWSATLRPLARTNDGTDLPMAFVPAPLRTRWLERRKQYLARQTDQGFAAAAAVAATSGRAVRDLREGGARILAGTDTFDAFVVPGHSLHQELELLVKAGLSPAQALETATRSAAEYRGTAQTEGTVTVGKRADLVLLDADPTIDISNARRVHMVVVNGRIHSRDALDRMLTDVRSFAGR